MMTIIIQLEIINNPFEKPLNSLTCRVVCVSTSDVCLITFIHYMNELILTIKGIISFSHNVNEIQIILLPPLVNGFIWSVMENLRYIHIKPLFGTLAANIKTRGSLSPWCVSYIVSILTVCIRCKLQATSHDWPIKGIRCLLPKTAHPYSKIRWYLKWRFH